MTKTTTQLKKAVEIYFNDLQRIRALGGGTGERSFYGPLANLLNAIGDTLKPKVSCVIELADQGAGHPDLGLYAARQMQKGQPREGQIPECGVIEVKPAGDDTWMVAKGDQVSRYWERYRLVLVTNTHDFILVGEDFAVTAGWGRLGSGSAVMPGKGRAIERDYTRDERIALGDAIPTLGESTFDIYLNDRAYWRNIPAAIWDYKLGGYQVLKKWLSYREHKVLDRALSPEEVQYFADTARRIGAILLMKARVQNTGNYGA